MDRDVRVGDLTALLRVELSRNWLVLLAVVACQVAANLLLDATLGESSLFGAGFVTMAAQLVYYRQSLNRWGVDVAEGTRFFSFWGMSILSGIGILLGSLLFILPGFYLNARWLLAGPLIVGDGESAGDSLSESFERTRDMVWPIFGLTLPIYLTGYLPTFMVAYRYGEGPVPMALTAVTYLGAFCATGVVWMLAVAIYRERLDKTEELVEVFA